MWCIFGRPWWWKIIIASVKGVVRFRQIHYNLHIGLQVDKYTANTHCDVRVLIVFAGCHESRTNDRRCPPSSFHGTTIAFRYFYTPFALLVCLSPCLSRNTIYFAVYTTTNDRCSRYNYCVRKKKGLGKTWRLPLYIKLDSIYLQNRCREFTFTPPFFYNVPFEFQYCGERSRYISLAVSF